MNEENFQSTDPKEPSPDERFLALFVTNQKRIFGFIQALVPHRTDAEDLMQETVMAMWRMFDRFSPDGDFSAWGIQIARYRILTYRKKENLRVRLSDEALERVLEHVDIISEADSNRLEALESCLGKLSEDDSRLLQMRYGQEVTIKGIAEQMGRSIQGMYKVIARIHASLQQCVNRTLRAWEMT
jgi:RNA polymerase sigma-70 factor (ECF subfamily)